MAWHVQLTCVCDDCGVSEPAVAPAAENADAEPPVGWIERPRHRDAFNAREPTRHYCDGCRKYHSHEA